jgi:hypothetical protein
MPPAETSAPALVVWNTISSYDCVLVYAWVDPLPHMPLSWIPSSIRWSLSGVAVQFIATGSWQAPPTSGARWSRPARAGRRTAVRRLDRISSRVMTCAFVALWTSTTGEAPDTVTVSSSPPTFISAFTVAVKSVGNRISSRLTVEKPVSENVTA